MPLDLCPFPGLIREASFVHIMKSSFYAFHENAIIFIGLSEYDEGGFGNVRTRAKMIEPGSQEE